MKKRTKIIGGSVAALLLVGGISSLGSSSKDSSPTTTQVIILPSEVPESTAAIVSTTTVSVTTTTAFIVPTVLVTRIVDGDTIGTSDGNTIRLIGIDTPEKGECGYKEAARVLSDLVLNKSVLLTPGAKTDTDRYGRLLRYVEYDSVDVNAYMIQSGRAIARYDSRDGYGKHPREDQYVTFDESSSTVNVCTVATQPTATTSAPVVIAPSIDVYYKNCAAARAAGASPLYAGKPGYLNGLDGDGDGVACE
jgi:endonuclease YncB( thermonuclease family)